LRFVANLGQEDIPAVPPTVWLLAQLLANCGKSACQRIDDQL
jgi:hypothetical protein